MSQTIPTIHLQEVGQWKAKPASEFAVGDFAVWNGGSTSEIISIAPKGQTQLAWKIRTKDGKVWDRVVKANRLVAFSDHHVR